MPLVLRADDRRAIVGSLAGRRSRPSAFLLSRPPAYNGKHGREPLQFAERTDRGGGIFVETFSRKALQVLHNVRHFRCRIARCRDTCPRVRRGYEPRYQADTLKPCRKTAARLGLRLPLAPRADGQGKRCSARDAEMPMVATKIGTCPSSCWRARRRGRSRSGAWPWPTASRAGGRRAKGWPPAAGPVKLAGGRITKCHVPAFNSG